jgi:hypothetical protein
MRVMATSLTNGISITLVEDDDGWRFIAWSRHASLLDEQLLPPAEDARARRFATADEALGYFRTLALASIHDLTTVDVLAS